MSQLKNDPTYFIKRPSDKSVKNSDLSAGSNPTEIQPWQETPKKLSKIHKHLFFVVCICTQNNFCITYKSMCMSMSSISITSKLNIWPKTSKFIDHFVLKIGVVDIRRENLIKMTGNWNRKIFRNEPKPMEMELKKLTKKSLKYISINYQFKLQNDKWIMNNDLKNCLSHK